MYLSPCKNRIWKSLKWWVKLSPGSLRPWQIGLSEPCTLSNKIIAAKNSLVAINSSWLQRNILTSIILYSKIISKLIMQNRLIIKIVLVLLVVSMCLLINYIFLFSWLTLLIFNTKISYTTSLSLKGQFAHCLQRHTASSWHLHKNP